MGGDRGGSGGGCGVGWSWLSATSMLGQLREVAQEVQTAQATHIPSAQNHLAMEK